NAALALALAGSLGSPPAAVAADLAATAARPAGAGPAAAFEGVVEAVRQTVVAAQVPGAVVELRVKVGDRVSAGQLLLRLDARAADQSAAASDAQVQAARAALDVAAKDFERQRQLFQQNYISQAALEQAESRFKSTQAQFDAQQAQAGAARTQTGFYAVRAPFAGVVSDVPVSLGDMAMPGRALLTLYDPAALRVTAALPQSVSAGLVAGQLPRIELPGLAAPRQWVQPLRAELLPTVDPGTHTVQMRADLPAGLPALAPGMYARLWLPVATTNASAGLLVPQAAVVRRAELTALYVLDPAGKPVLRQVRLGRTEGDRVEVLAGLTAGERVVADPQAAARVSPAAR
ncbi:MAG: efflux RND transporter periplasmic adaptor subunit, partial [Bacteroidia bacterium]